MEDAAPKRQVQGRNAAPHRDRFQPTCGTSRGPSRGSSTWRKSASPTSSASALRRCRAFDSICRIRSRVSRNICPISSRVRGRSSSSPNLRAITSRSRRVRPDVHLRTAAARALVNTTPSGVSLHPTSIFIAATAVAAVGSVPSSLNTRSRDTTGLQSGLALERRFLSAGVEERCTLDDFGWTNPIQVDRRHLNELPSLHFLQKKEHVLLIGPVGVGKAFLAQAVGAAATRAGDSVLFRRADLLLRELGQSRADHSFETVFRRYLAPDLLVIDDFGLHRLTQQESEDLYALIIELQLHRHVQPRRGRVGGALCRSYPRQLGPRPAANGAHQLVIDGPSYCAKLAPRQPQQTPMP